MRGKSQLTAEDAEDAEGAQRLESILCAPSALSASSAVNLNPLGTQFQIDPLPENW
jgi:hypothetical protein